MPKNKKLKRKKEPMKPPKSFAEQLQALSRDPIGIRKAAQAGFKAGMKSKLKVK